jgi:hypothetical protein
MKFLRTEDGKDWFNFVCTGCQSEGEIGIPREDGMQPFGCPEGCGATYVRWYPKAEGNIPALKCVVQPYFGTARSKHAKTPHKAN